MNLPTLIDELYDVIDVVSASTYSIALCSLNIDMIILFWLRTNGKINHILTDINKLIKLFYGNTNKVYSTLLSEHGGNGHNNFVFCDN